MFCISIGIRFFFQTFACFSVVSMSHFFSYSLFGFEPTRMAGQLKRVQKMSYATGDAPTTVHNSSQSSSGVDCQCEEELQSATESPAVSHYPLGSWERHLLEERLRAMKDYERERLLQEELNKECTFQPRLGISRGYENEVHGNFASADYKQRHVPVFERLTNLAKEREARLALIAEEKKRSEEEALQHAFRPRVNSVPEQHVPFASDRTRIPVEERLLHYGKSVEQSRRLLQQQRQQKEMEELRQKATVRRTHSNVSGEKPQSDIAKRSKRLLIERETQRAVAQQALLKEHSFCPKVCTMSDAIDRTLKANKNVRDRGLALYEEGMRRQQQRHAETVQRQIKESNGLHKPTTNPLTKSWIHHGQHRGLFQQDFIRRQKIYQRVKEEHQRNLVSALEQSERAEVPRVSQEMIQRQVERLYLGAQEIRAEAKKRIEDNIKSRECPFRPQLAPGTAYVIARTQREEDVVKRLASAPRGRYARHHSFFETTSVEEKEEDGGSLPRKSKCVHPDEAAEFYDRQRQAMEDREMQLREQKQRLAMEELCACTFRPRTCTDEYLHRRQTQATREAAQQPVEARVSGVSAYLQRQSEARRRLREQESRYNNLGRGLQCNGGNSTVITPFNLSSGRGTRLHRLSSSWDELKTSGGEEDGGHYHVDPCSKNGTFMALHEKLAETSSRPRMR
ncbi:200 kDa antigen p200 [Trypanosoma rangeli]|uniref:200 kDa antigen p200 n=1 Tax=Trypanosoma rangeli TaxID=5698 RepID=A0A422P5F8_TRYRA|nr:200 kDa antigen p200 [Trypanosoma rangeli]RNF12904.1 200 kDa antigen p200 [Trypanosoma rangeli]|eukprot:RNF12904.1 200 kDa antigen p200 [Trypanosoma rangeli]